MAEHNNTRELFNLNESCSSPLPSPDYVGDNMSVSTANQLNLANPGMLLGKRQVSVAAAVAAVARGRRRGFEPDQQQGNEIAAHLAHNNSTFELNIGDKLPDMGLSDKSSFQSQTVSYDIPQTQFSRSAVGGAKFVTNCHPMNADDYDSLEFESRFESGNLAKAVQITPTYYELYLRPDLYTSRSKQWFYFRVRRTHRNMLYRFSIVNLVKSDSLYNDGMRPVMYSTLGAKEKNEGWRRCGNNISYYRNDDEWVRNTARSDYRYISLFYAKQYNQHKQRWGRG